MRFPLFAVPSSVQVKYRIVDISEGREMSREICVFGTIPRQCPSECLVAKIADGVRVAQRSLRAVRTTPEWIVRARYQPLTEL
jgi:hypothetical protein